MTRTKWKEASLIGLVGFVVVAAVVASAVVPTRHLLESSVESEPAASPTPSEVTARRVS